MKPKGWKWMLGLGCLTVASAACATRGFAGVAVTKDPAVVASCQKLDDLSLPPNSDRDIDNMQALLQLANAKGANTLLVASDEAREGVAYRCTMPAAAGTR